MTSLMHLALYAGVLAVAVRAPLQSAPAAPTAAPSSAASQPAAAAPTPEIPAPAPDADEAARAAGLSLLDAAARFQRGDQPRGLPASLHGRFYVGVRDGDGSMLKATVERWYTAQPERLLTHRTEAVTGSASSVCYDAGTAWFHDDASSEIVVYSDAPEIHDVDLELLAEQRRLTRLLLQAAVLDALRPRLTQVTSIGERQIKDLEGGTHAAGLVSARLDDELFDPPTGAPPPAPGEPPRQLELSFAIDRDSGALWELAVAAVGRADVEPLRMHFDFHGETRNGLRVPGNIKVFRGDESRESLNLGVALDPEGKLVFDVDATIDDTVFEKPAR